MMRLPLWADTPQGRALLADIVADVPEVRITSGAWIEGGGRTIYRAWKRPDVARFKRLYSEWWNANHETATEAPEDPDSVIARAIREAAVPYSPIEWTESDDGNPRIAA